MLAGSDVPRMEDVLDKVLGDLEESLFTRSSSIGCKAPLTGGTM